MSFESVLAQVSGECGPVRASWSLDLTPQPSQVGRARAFTRECLAEADEAQIELVLLLLSEVVTNAVLYGRSRLHLELSLHSKGAEGAQPHEPAAVLAAVTDASSRLPRQRPPSESSEHGRGLQIVGALSDSWGCTELEGGTGKIVWFVVGSRSVAGVNADEHRSAAEQRAALGDKETGCG